MLHLGVSILGMTKAQRLQYGESLMTHAMLITAVQLKVRLLDMILITRKVSVKNSSNLLHSISTSMCIRKCNKNWG